MNIHQLKKIEEGWICGTCNQQWKKKPQATCPGVLVYKDLNDVPKHLTTEQELEKLNLKPKRKAVGCYKKSSERVWLYESDKTKIADPNLPPVYTWDNRPKDIQTPNQLCRYNRKPGDNPHGCIWHKDGWVYLYKWEECPIDNESLPPYIENGSAPELETPKKLKQKNLVPGNAKPRGFYRFWDKWEGWVTVLLYHPEDCEWEPSDNYITKTTLRSRYLLSDSWISRLGQADLLMDNPHYPNRAEMQLYSRQRVEKLLADNAEEYAKWMDDREKYVAIFEANREVIKEGQTRYLELKNKRRNQMEKCLRCASGCATGRGFICVIYPKGLEDSQMPCIDFRERVSK